ncbi:hypothetical protein BJ138DRAFT_1182245 [Hygrophoropsis aurantiaca]|uniref:Uncharacterized protein n=1 Tax=Hygrophoropsis aurantiaca TaxID=72124 RepID=A0ACB8A3E1_9AGAM|nr:hypothetical protein BJ138DRAFT_1182245 [Hygrophoropsis aurantiaca]
MTLNPIVGSVYDTLTTIQTTFNLHSVLTLSEDEPGLRLKLADAATHAENLASAIRQCINRLAPIYRLPDELLIRIFEEHIKDPSGHNWAEARLLALVSRRWRLLAINTPALWTCISFTPFENIEIPESYVQRSGEYPIEVNFACWAATPASYNELASALRVLYTCVARMRRLQISDMAPKLLQWLLPRLDRMHALSLTHVSLHNNAGILDLKEPCPFVSGCYSPAIRSLEVAGIRLSNRQIPLNLRALTSLTLGDEEATKPMIDHSAFHQLLSSTPQLTRLIIRNSAVHFHADGLTKAVCLPALHTLIFRGNASRHFCEYQFLASLSAPSLARLELSECLTRFGEYRDPTPQFMDGANQPKFPLAQRFYVGRKFYNPQHVPLFILGLPHVTHVSIAVEHLKYLSKELAKMVAGRPAFATTAAWGQLQSLRVQYRPEIRIPDNALCDWLAVRRDVPGLPPLKIIIHASGVDAVDSPVRITGSQWQWVRNLTARGAEVTFEEIEVVQFLDCEAGICKPPHCAVHTRELHRYS